MLDLQAIWALTKKPLFASQSTWIVYCCLSHAYKHNTINVSSIRRTEWWFLKATFLLLRYQFYRECCETMPLSVLPKSLGVHNLLRFLPKAISEEKRVFYSDISLAAEETSRTNQNLIWKRAGQEESLVYHSGI